MAARKSVRSTGSQSPGGRHRCAVTGNQLPVRQQRQSNPQHGPARASDQELRQTKSSETHAFEYDGGATGALYGKGRLTKLTDPAAITTWTYTAHGRIASAAQKVGSLVQTVVYGYDIAGQRASVITPSGQTVTYAYANGRIAGVKVNAAAWSMTFATGNAAVTTPATNRSGAAV